MKHYEDKFAKVHVDRRLKLQFDVFIEYDRNNKSGDVKIFPDK